MQETAFWDLQKKYGDSTKERKVVNKRYYTKEEGREDVKDLYRIPKNGIRYKRQA